MKMLLTALLVALPAVAMAQNRIPDNVLREHNESCLAKCTETRSYAFCAETCTCMTGEMKRHWTVKDYQARSMKLFKNMDDRTLRNELGRMASHCAKRGMQSAQQ